MTGLRKKVFGLKIFLYIFIFFIGLLSGLAHILGSVRISKVPEGMGKVYFHIPISYGYIHTHGLTLPLKEILDMPELLA